MIAPPPSVVSGVAGEFVCEPPWTSVHPSPAACGILGVGPGSTLTIDELGTAHCSPSGTGLHHVVRETVRTGDPLALAGALLRRSDASVRTIVLVTESHEAAGRMPRLVRGHVVDVTDPVGDLDGRALTAVVECGPALVLLLTGEIDMAARPDLAAAVETLVRHPARGPVFVDLNRVGFIDAAGVSLLADAARRLTRRARPVTAVHVSPVLRKVLAVADTAGLAVRSIPGDR